MSQIKTVTNYIHQKNNISDIEKRLDLCTLYIFVENLRYHEEGFIPIINYFCIPPKLIYIPNFTNELIKTSHILCYSYLMRQKLIGQ
jgi:hypothetical protein